MFERLGNIGQYSEIIRKSGWVDEKMNEMNKLYKLNDYYCYCSIWKLIRNKFDWNSRQPNCKKLVNWWAAKLMCLLHYFTKYYTANNVWLVLINYYLF